MINLKIEYQPFNRDLDQTLKNTRTRLVNWAYKSGDTIQLKTTPYVPLDKGYLENSFFKEYRSSSTEFQLKFGYNVQSNPKTSFDYAYTQHERMFHHSRRGTDHYLDYGVRDSEDTVFQDLEKEIDQALR